jgi:3-oxoacyl-[acyl-carrier-protein] synthase II
MSRSQPTVVVTGLGAASPFGWGRAALWEGLRAGRAAIAEFDRFDHVGQRTHVAAQVPGPYPWHLLGPQARARATSYADLFALAAAAEALDQAGLPADLSTQDAGVFFGGSTAGMFESEEFFAAFTAVGADGSSQRRTRLAALAAQQINAPADAVARRHAVGGAVMTVSSACSSATLALGQALDALRAGEVEVALAGGSDALCRLTYAGFNSLRSVDAAPCRPFRADREGLSLGEGGAVLVLETEAHARARGARPLAILAGVGASCDAHHMTAPDPSGAGVVRAIRAALDDAEMGAEAITFVNAHGTGTPLNDAAEWQALKTVFGARAAALPVTSTKGNLGHFLGSAGAIEAVATVLCLLHGVVHPTPGAGIVESGAAADPVDLVLGAPRPVPAGAALSTNFAFGGSNAVAVFRAAEPRPSRAAA